MRGTGRGRCLAGLGAAAPGLPGGWRFQGRGSWAGRGLAARCGGAGTGRGPADPLCGAPAGAGRGKLVASKGRTRWPFWGVRRRGGIPGSGG
jgi:hypothetical protein